MLVVLNYYIKTLTDPSDLVALSDLFERGAALCCCCVHNDWAAFLFFSYRQSVPTLSPALFNTIHLESHYLRSLLWGQVPFWVLSWFPPHDFSGSVFYCHHVTKPINTVCVVLIDDRDHGLLYSGNHTENEILGNLWKPRHLHDLKEQTETGVRWSITEKKEII